MPRAVTCLLNKSQITIEHALNLRRDAKGGGSSRLDFRCSACQQPVKPHKESAYGAAHFEHMERNEKCTLSDPSRD